MAKVFLQKTGLRNFMGGAFAKHKTLDINCKSLGFVEACYDYDLARELTKLAKRNFWDESVGFVAAVNHLMLRRAKIGTSLHRIAGLETGRHGGHTTLNDHMQQTFDRFVSNDGEKTVNVAYKTRKLLSDRWSSILSGQAVAALMDARNEIAGMCVKDSLSRFIGSVPISKKLATTLQMEVSPTDAKVMERLSKMGPMLIIHQGGRLLSNEETLQQYRQLHGVG